MHARSNTGAPAFDFCAELRAGTDAIDAVLAPACVAAIAAAGRALQASLTGGRKVLICGNGGSAADAQHIAAELVGRYRAERRGLPAIALTTDSSVLTAWSNDYDFDSVFSRQVEALGQPGDLVLGLSTSGRSRNVARALQAAREAGCTTVGLLGRDGGTIAPLCDVAVVVPLQDTARIQEAHMLAYHTLCAYLDACFAGAQAPTVTPRRGHAEH